MRPIVPLRVLGIVGLAAAAAAAAMVGASSPVAEMGHAADGATVPASGHDLESLSLLRTVLFHVDESYVDPGRIDYEAMARAGLEAIERRVPSAMFRRAPGGSLLHVEIGDHRSVIEVPPITDRRALEAHLLAVAVEISQHLDPVDVPLDDPAEDPLAQVEYALVNGVLSTLDPHSVLLPPEASQQMDVENDGSFGGLGVVLSERDGRLRIEQVEPEGPADLSGLQDGDVITRIEGVSTVNMTMRQAVELLRGALGEPVRLEVRRSGGAPFGVVLVRDTIALHPVESELLPGDVGYIRIESFHKRVGADVVEALASLTAAADGALAGIVLDLRGNPGGYLQQAVAVADAFLWAGTIVSTVDADNTPRDQQLARAKAEPKYPMVVLVDGTSASASEIVAGALRNNGRAVIVGARTFGKGSVQNLHDLSDGSKLKLTISKYLTPNDQSIQGLGIPADVELVPTVATAVGDAEHGLFAGELITREADLDAHLELAERDLEEPAFRLRYLTWADAPVVGDKAWKAGDDRQVSAARDLLLAAPSWRRSETLASAAAVVERWDAREQAAIERAFSAAGVDWRNGSSRGDGLSVEARVPDGALTAGSTEPVRVTVANLGAAPAARVVVVMTSDNHLLNGREAVIGYLRPGETRSVDVPIAVPPGWGPEEPLVRLSVRDSGESEVAVRSAPVVIEGTGAPTLTWSWSIEDRGDGDGIVDVGDALALSVTVVNEGDGPTAEAVVMLRNRSGGAVDLDAGRFMIGSGATPVLAPGESWHGTLSWTVVAAPEGQLDLVLELADEQAYDHGAIDVAQLYEYFVHRDPVVLTVGAPLPEGVERAPPSIVVSRDAPRVSEGARSVVSGQVFDADGVRHVMVWNGDDKVFYQGSVRGDPVASVPFTADLALKHGENVVTIVAVDNHGLASLRSTIIRYDGADLQAKAWGPG